MSYLLLFCPLLFLVASPKSSPEGKDLMNV